MKDLPVKPAPFKKGYPVYLDSPFYEKDGLLEFKKGFTNPQFLANWSFAAHLYGLPVWIDHFVLTFPNRSELENYAQSFHPFGAKIVEGPDLFPIKFCLENITVPTDLWIHLMTLLMPSGGLVVLDAPHAPGDQKDRFQRERGLEAVHHVAIRADDLYSTAKQWEKQGFQPLSERPLDYGSLTQWFLKNSAGQIIELIWRRPGNNATFDCNNIAGLRLSEDLK